MAYQQRPSSRRDRRQQDQSSGEHIELNRFDLPGPLKFISNPKVFLVMGVVFGASIVLSLAVGFQKSTNTTTTPNNGVIHQANEAPDVARDVAGTPAASASSPTPEPTSTLKHYTAAPPMTIDPTKHYTASIQTSKGNIQIELYPDQAPQAVNAFVFLAQDGYYNNTPFMDVARNSDGSQFTVQTGDPTGTGLGTPGFTLGKELTTKPFDKGAVGMDSGQFFFSLGDYPALTGKYTIFGQVTSGLDILTKLNLLTPKTNTGQGDTIQSVTITQS